MSVVESNPNPNAVLFRALAEELHATSGDPKASQPAKVLQNAVVRAQRGGFEGTSIAIDELQKLASTPEGARLAAEVGVTADSVATLLGTIVEKLASQATKTTFPRTPSTPSPRAEITAPANTPEYFRQLQAQVATERAEMSPILQFALPVKGNKITPKQMEAMNERIENDPLLKAVVHRDAKAMSLTKFEDAVALIDTQVRGKKVLEAMAGSIFAGMTLGKTPEFALCKELVKGLAVKPSHAIMAAYHLREMGVDAGELGDILKAFTAIREKALAEPQDSTFKLPEFWVRLNKKALYMMLRQPLIKALALLGPGVVEHEREPSGVKFKAFLATVHTLSSDHELYTKLFAVCRLPSAERDTAYQYLRIVRLVYGLTQVDGRDAAMQALQDMIDKGKADFEPMARTYVEKLAAHVGYSGPVDFSAWDLEYVHLMSTAYRETLDGKKDPIFPAFKKKNELTTLLQQTFSGTYEAMRHDPATAAGKANIATKASFAEAGLDYDKWLTYTGRTSFKLANGTEMVWKLWDAKPGRDIYQGTFAQSCAALDAGRGETAVDDLQFTLLQQAELTDPKTGKTVGSANVYFAQGAEGPFMVVDTTQMKKGFRESPEIREALATFLREFSVEVAGKAVPIRVGTNFNRLEMKDLDKSRHKFTVVGDTADHRYHFNSLVKSQFLYLLSSNAKPQQVTGPQKTSLFSLYEP